jgi:His/Glu/Gln/Arg/opine family amino acid ABC transporter permease subunit
VTTSSAPERIPFWRNVKTIGIAVQVVFVVVIAAGIGVLVSNVLTALRTANLPADFSWMGSRAGIPIAETPIPYTVADPYWKALLIGFLNTLRVALIGVVLASLIGVLVGVMRLASNWLVRTLASVYIELLRNIPLAVQIVFWYSAVLLPIPPRLNNPIELPGGVLLSNVGLAFPFLYPSYRFGAWVPWLVAAVVLAVIAAVWRDRALKRADRVGRVWPYPLAAFVLTAAVGYGVASIGTAVPDTYAIDFNVERGRGTVFRDLDGDGVRGRGEPVAPFASTIVRVAAAQLTTTTQNLVESRRNVDATFRFPLVRETDVASVEVVFDDAAAAEEAGYRLHFFAFPSRGLVYQDRDGDGEFTEGEQRDAATGVGFNGIRLIMRIEGYERPIVADRDGQVRTPAFAPLIGADGDGDGAAAADAAPAPSFSVFAPVAAADDAPAPLVADVELRPAGPLVLSRVHVPVGSYEGGQRFTVNYLALLLALVIYTSAFIGEIVRGGIQAVAKGQREAAQALGLSGYQIFTLVVFPQALRIVLPPVISQFLNLTKNSSLAPLAGYAELFVVAGIVANQTGASIPIALLLVVSYLTISLVFAYVLNVVNDRLALVER